MLAFTTKSGGAPVTLERLIYNFDPFVSLPLKDEIQLGNDPRKGWVLLVGKEPEDSYYEAIARIGNEEFIVRAKPLSKAIGIFDSDNDQVLVLMAYITIGGLDISFNVRESWDINHVLNQVAISLDVNVVIPV